MKRIFLSLICVVILLAPVTTFAGNGNGANNSGSTGSFNGAIYTSSGDGTTVNANLYQSKADVYLDGGPQNGSSSGLPDGQYYFQVTDPSGATLLSSDPVSCRVVNIVNGRFAGAPAGGCYHANGSLNVSNGTIPVQLQPFNDTPNGGGEYKVWLTPVDSYDPTFSKGTWGFVVAKTDSFKVSAPGKAYVTACKFEDTNGNGTQDEGEDPIGGWTINATGVDNPESQKTAHSNGCATFNVSQFPNNGAATVVLTEESKAGWQQITPAGGSFTVTVNPGETAGPFWFGNQKILAAAPIVSAPEVAGTYKTTYGWGITKSVDNETLKSSTVSAAFNYTVTVTRDEGTNSNYQVAGELVITNRNADPITIDTVGAALSDGTSCAIDQSAEASNLTISGNSHADLSFTCPLGGMPDLPVNATVSIAWSDQTLSNSFLVGGTATDSATIAAFEQSKFDDCASVSDNYENSLGSAPVCATTTFNYSHTFSGTAGTCSAFTNTATFTTNTTAATGSASKDVKLCVGADLNTAINATPSFTSALTKTGPASPVEFAGGTGTTLNYTVTVKQSGWNVAGTVTVSNPNDWEAITASVADPCGSANSTSVTVPASGSSTVAYNCALTSADFPGAASGTKSANVTWDAGAAFTPDAAQSATSSGYTFQMLHVTDTFNNGTPKMFPAIAPGTASVSFADSYTVNPIGGTCGTYTNVATLDDPSNQSRTVTTNACNYATGALTIGFWQNKNGQGIISGSGSGVCPVATVMQSYAPFADLSATATCSQTATYVYNIIKAANASGASMNAMLKAQMLATFLDAYFSAAIKAPSPIANVNIDLTKVCSMSDGSGGAATCSGAYGNASTAFNGQTSMTVSQLLVWAASQSNAGGSMWYGNNKAIQQLAKNTFDAINNAKALLAP